MQLDIQTDGLTTVITLSRALTPGSTFSCLLREDEGGWFVQEGSGSDRSLRIGRRKTWQKALHDALVWAELQLDEIDVAAGRR